jgi:hypothetical protein
LNKCDVRILTGFGTEYESVAGNCEHGNETLVSMKGEQFLDNLRAP